MMGRGAGQPGYPGGQQGFPGQRMPGQPGHPGQKRPGYGGMNTEEDPAVLLTEKITQPALNRTFPQSYPDGQPGMPVPGYPQNHA